MILYADDQYVTQQQFMLNFNEIGISNKVAMFSDGKALTDYIDQVLNDLDLSDHVAGQRPLWPISLILLDINMPIMNGFDTMKLVKEKFRLINAYAS